MAIAAQPSKLRCQAFLRSKTKSLSGNLTKSNHFSRFLENVISFEYLANNGEHTQMPVKERVVRGEEVQEKDIPTMPLTCFAPTLSPLLYMPLISNVPSIQLPSATSIPPHPSSKPHRQQHYTKHGAPFTSSSSTRAARQTSVSTCCDTNYSVHIPAPIEIHMLIQHSLCESPNIFFWLLVKDKVD